MTTKMTNPKTGETIRVPGRRVKDHLQNGYEIADGSEVPEGNVDPNEAEVTKEELYERAQELDIEGRSKMNKQELEKAVEEAEDAQESGSVGSGSVEAETGELQDEDSTAPVVKAETDATSTNPETQVRHNTL